MTHGKTTELDRPIKRRLWVMGVIIAAVLVLAGGLTMCAKEAVAQMVKSDPASRCAPRDRIAKVLHQKYQERQSAFGVIGSAAVIEIYTSEKGGWTILRTSRANISCILAAGHGYQAVKRKGKET